MREFFVVLSLVLISIVGHCQISSDFAFDADGWTVPSALSGIINYSAAGGNPTGYVTASDVDVRGIPIFWYYQAPSKFLGNLTPYYNGTLSFDLTQGAITTPTQRADVVLTSNSGITLYYFNLTPASPSTTSWTSYKIPLNELSGNWKTTNSAIGAVATQADVQAVLVDLATLQIRGRFGSAPLTTTGLDNVLIQPFIITKEPSSVSVCDGVTTSLTISVVGNTGIIYQWQKLSGRSYFNVVDGGGYSGATTSTLSINTTGIFGVGTYRCVVSQTGANNLFSASVNVAVNALPTAPTVAGNSSCGPSAITLNAFGGTNGLYQWYPVATGGTSITGEINSTFVTPLLTSATTYYVAISDRVCESLRTPVIATVNTVPAAPTTIGGSACGSSTVTLNASGGANGQYRWYTSLATRAPILGEVNGSYTTPLLITTTPYYVSINDGLCESARILVTATINTPPNAPTAAGVSICSGTSTTLNASGGANGQYKWYTDEVGGIAIAGAVNSNYVTPTLSAATTYYVAIFDGKCESPRTQVIATINAKCTPPIIEAEAMGAKIGGKATLNLVDQIRTAKGTELDLASLQVIIPPSSGGKASISTSGILTVDYTGLKFSGKENIRIQACDQNSNCAQQLFTIQVGGEIVIYNAVSPNGDEKNDFLRLEFIDALSPKNQVFIYSRWGDEVFSVSNYNNDSRKFAGFGNDGGKLPVGTYFYKIVLLDEGKTLTGFLEIKY